MQSAEPPPGSDLLYRLAEQTVRQAAEMIEDFVRANRTYPVLRHRTDGNVLVTKCVTKCVSLTEEQN